MEFVLHGVAEAAPTAARVRLDGDAARALLCTMRSELEANENDVRYEHKK